MTIVAANEPERGVLAAVSDIDELVVSKDDMQIMVLGRYQNSRRHVRQLLAKSNVEFSTIHSAKGRETDYVIVLDLGDGYQGFPSRRRMTRFLTWCSTSLARFHTRKSVVSSTSP